MANRKLELFQGHERWAMPLALLVIIAAIVWVIIMALVAFIAWEVPILFGVGGRVTMLISLVISAVITGWYLTERDRIINMEKSLKAAMEAEEMFRRADEMRRQRKK